MNREEVVEAIWSHVDATLLHGLGTNWDQLQDIVMHHLHYEWEDSHLRDEISDLGLDIELDEEVNDGR